jgi:sterol desaturase/sphingolipid hydroxylase (fatty acid hydroxylase superfamily)
MKTELWGLSPFLQLLITFLLFVFLGAAAALLEWRFPARIPGISWRKVYFGEDSLVLIGVVGAGALLQFFQLKLTLFLGQVSTSESTHVFSVGKSFLLVFGVLDFLMYWLHRGMHSRILWPVHRWHHSIQRMNWLSGVRISLTELLLNSVPSYVIYLIWPETLIWAVVYFFYTNIIIHLNLEIHSPRVARWLVLPQYHRVHHGMESQFHNHNFSIFWTFWDRLFGTYLNPDTIQDNYALGLETGDFGSKEFKTNPRPWRLAIGI